MNNKKLYLWASLYVLSGFIYVIVRLWRKGKFEKMMQEAYKTHPSPVIVDIAAPLALVVAVLSWPMLFGRFVYRKIRGIKNEHD